MVQGVGVQGVGGWVHRISLYLTDIHTHSLSLNLHTLSLTQLF